MSHSKFQLTQHGRKSTQKTRERGQLRGNATVIGTGT